MAKATYAVGDHVYLLQPSIRNGRAEGQFEIIGLLPDTERGEAQYRVQSKQENFERRVRATEIDAELSAPTNVASKDAMGGGNDRSWIKPLSTRAKK